ncbi:MAG TPA: NDP-sugar synthase [Candidatus Deferrimicrobiaceae bacterium]
MKGMILAAGLGTRLHPLSYEIPKPIVPVLGRPLCTWSLAFLARSGVKSFVLNVHQHPRMIQQAVLDWAGGRIPSHFTVEPEILGTGGGIGNARNHLRGGTFVTANGDAIVRFDFARALAFHRRKKSLATLVLFPNDARRYTPAWIRPSGRITGFGADSGDGRLSGFYTGVQILEPELLDRIPHGKPSCIIRDIYVPLIAQGAPIHGFLTKGSFREFGTPADYLRETIGLLGEPAERDPLPPFPRSGIEIVQPAWISPKARIAPGAVIGPNAVIEENASVESGAAVSHAVVWPGAVVRQGETLRNAILTPHRRVDIPLKPQNSKEEETR